MGKATIVQHYGGGEYRISLTLDQAGTVARLAQLDQDIAELDARVTAAADRLEAAQAAIQSAQDAINDKINEVQSAFFDLANALTAANANYDAAKSALDHETSVLKAIKENRDQTLAAFDAALEDLQAQYDAATTDDQRQAIQNEIDGTQADREQTAASFDEALRVQREAVDAATAALNSAKSVRDGKQSEWDNRPQNVDVITKMLADTEPQQAELTAARLEHGELVLRRASKAQERAWLAARKQVNPELTAWCADLSEGLAGEIATIEVPGERREVPVLIRPGYGGRAVWQPGEQHAAQVAAVTAAQRLLLEAGEALALARLNVKAAESLVADRQRWRDLMMMRVIEFPELAESAEAQLAAAHLVLEAAEAAVPPAESAVTDARAGLLQARTALQVVRDAAAQPDATPDPRMADGLLQPVASSNPWAAFWNQAVLPAWEKWRPMYRIGTLTALSDNIGTVQLDPALSSQQNIPINREQVLEQVPIIYMECNGAAFQVGDRVVVEFAYHDQAKPRVIGFESNPRPCSLHGIIVLPCSSLSPDGWGKPITSDNAPWGTPGIAENHNLNLVGYYGPQGGVGTQALLSFKQDTLSLVHGAAWFSQVDTSGAASSREDYARGGFLGIRRGSDVWSTSGHWLPQLRGDYVVNRDGTVDKNTVWPPGVGDVSAWGRVDGILYRNGKPHDFSNVSGTFVLGVGFHATTAAPGSPSVDRMILITLNPYTRTLYVQVSDPPYTELNPIANRHFEPLAPNTAFFVNASGTEAIGITLDLVTRIGKDGNPASFFEHVIHRIAIEGGGASASFSEQQGPGYPDEVGSAADEWIQPRDGYSYWLKTTSDNSNAFSMPIAVGYAGDTEKILSVSGSYSIHSEREAFFWGVISLGGPGGVDVYKHQNAAHAGSFDPGYIEDRTETSLLTYDINGKTVATFSTDNSYRTENYAIISVFTGYDTVEAHYIPQPLEKVSDTPYLIEVDFLHDVLYYGRIKQFFRFGIGWDTSGLIAVRDQNGDWHVPPVEVYANEELLGSLTIGTAI